MPDDKFSFCVIISPKANQIPTPWLEGEWFNPSFLTILMKYVFLYTEIDIEKLT